MKMTRTRIHPSGPTARSRSAGSRWSDFARLGLLLGGFMLLGVAPRSTSAQAPPVTAPAPAPELRPEWAEIRVISDAELRQWKRNNNFVRTMKEIVEGKVPLEGGEKDFFDLYIAKYCLPQFTQEKLQPKLPELRDELLGYYRTAAAHNNSAVTNRLNELIFDLSLAIAKGTVRAEAQNGGGVDVIQVGQPPNVRYFRLDMREIPAGLVARTVPTKVNFRYAARFNAMLLFGELNEKMDVHRNQITREVPMFNALEPMTDIVADESYPQFVRAAALIGIERHLDTHPPVEQADIPPAPRETIVNAIMKIASQSKLSSSQIEETEYGNLWIRRQAINILGACGSESSSERIEKLLSGVIADHDAPLKLRSAAAEAEGRLKRAKAQPGTATALAKQLAGLAVDAAKFELSVSVDKQPQFSRRRAGGTFGSVLAGLAGRRAVEAATAGQPLGRLSGVYPSATTDEQPFVKGIIERVGQLRAACGNLNFEEPELRGAFRDAVSSINSFVDAGPEAAANAERNGETTPAIIAPKPAPMRPAAAFPVPGAPGAPGR